MPHSPPKITYLLTLTLLLTTATSNLLFPVYASSCDNESLNISRTCPQKDNMIEYLMTIKKGGTNVLSTADYDKNFFLCEEFTFDCGYVEDDAESVSVANGIQLKFTAAEVDAILPANPALASTIKRYLNLTAAQAKCGMKVFPLTLTSAESDLFFTNYMNLLVTDVKSRYTSQKMNNTKSWTELNINIKTAVLQIIKQDKLALQSVFWDDFRWNNFTEMSDYLKKKYESTNQLYYLRSAYLIDSVTQRCNKHQSISFLIDQSGSIGNANFLLAKDFLKKYVEKTYDDPKLMSVHFYDTTFEPYLDFGKSKDEILSAVTAKTLRGGGTTTGDSINKTIDKILKANFDKGMNKILVVMTDGKSYDNVLDASNYARSKGITMIAVGIGSAIFEPQLLQIAQIQSNLIKVASYADLDKLVTFIENYFCKQIINVKVNETIIGNVVRVPESPAYFKLQRSLKNETFELRITYESDPDNHGQVMYRSEYDPFPDQFTQYELSQSYRLSLLERVYFVEPVQQQVVRIKKNYQKVQSFTNSYVSVAGTDLKFNISLSPCNSTGCHSQKASYQSYGSKINDSPIADKSYNIYGILAGSIAALACLSLIGLIALKKMTGDEEDEEEKGLNDDTFDDKFHPQMTENDLSDEDSRSSHSRRSSKRSHGKSDGKRSDRGKSPGKKSEKGKSPGKKCDGQKSDDDSESRKSGKSERSTSAKKPLKSPKKGGKK